MELPVVLWDSKTIAEYNCSMECLLPGHNCSDSSSASEIILIVADPKDIKKFHKINHHLCDM